MAEFLTTALSILIGILGALLMGGAVGAVLAAIGWGGIYMWMIAMLIIAKFLSEEVFLEDVTRDVSYGNLWLHFLGGLALLLGGFAAAYLLYLVLFDVYRFFQELIIWLNR